MLNPIGNKSVTEGTALKIAISASDPNEGDTLTYSAKNLPEGAVFDPDTRTFEWTADNDAADTYQVEFTVKDNGEPNLEDSETITITVSDSVKNPTLDPIGSKSVKEGELLEFTVSGPDPDEAVDATNLPPGATFDSENRKFSWTPGYDAKPSYDVFFSVTNSDVFEKVTITVENVNIENVNRAPELLPVGPQTVDEGSVLEFTVSGTDPDGDSSIVRYEANLPLPDGAYFYAQNRLFSWVPDYDKAGTYTVRFRTMTKPEHTP